MLEPDETSSALTRPTHVCCRVILTAGTAWPRTPGLKGVPGEDVSIVTDCAVAIDSRTTTISTIAFRMVRCMHISHHWYTVRSEMLKLKSEIRGQRSWSRRY